jgi:carbohydrate-selective porin OprB
LAPWLTAAVLFVALCQRAVAQEPASQESAPGDAAASVTPHDGDFWRRDALTGNWFGTRSALEDKGILLGGDEIDEVLGNVTGGIKTGVIDEGRLELLATLDLDKLFGWSDATFHVNAYQTHGRGRSANQKGGHQMTAGTR